jgi:hypothetical protein
MNAPDFEESAVLVAEGSGPQQFTSKEGKLL